MHRCYLFAEFNHLCKAKPRYNCNTPAERFSDTRSNGALFHCTELFMQKMVCMEGFSEGNQFLQSHHKSHRMKYATPHVQRLARDFLEQSAVECWNKKCNSLATTAKYTFGQKRDAFHEKNTFPTAKHEGGSIFALRFCGSWWHR